MPTAPSKALAVYGEKAMKAEGDELRSLELMKKKIAEEKVKASTKSQKPKMLKPAPETEKLLKKMAKGGKTSSASKRADGIAKRGKTRAR